MKLGILAAALLAALLIAPAALAGGGLVQVGQPFPAITFEAPPDDKQLAYLGVTPGDDLDPAAVNARLVIVEFLNIYCPHCPREASRVNALYELIQDKGWGDRVKMLGIGVTNTAEEVETFVKYYKVPFPVVPDYTLKSADILGEVYTPYFVVILRPAQGPTRVLYAADGALPPAQQFLADMAAQAGLQ